MPDINASTIADELAYYKKRCSELEGRVAKLEAENKELEKENASKEPFTVLNMEEEIQNEKHFIDQRVGRV